MTEEKSYLKKYEIPREYIKAVAQGYSKGFIFEGPQGIGKTFLVKKTLEEEGINYVESRGVTSPLALYIFLFENNQKDKVLVFDDTASLVNNENAFSILLGALWDGVISWNTTSEKLIVPPKFEFIGKIIIITNSLNIPGEEILKSRTLIYRLNLSRVEKIELMLDIAMQPHNKLKTSERMDIVQYISFNTDDSSIFDLRTQQKAESLYLFNKDKWQDLLKPLITNNSDVEVFLRCLETNETPTQAEKQFIKETGKSRATFWRIKKSLS